MVEQLASFDGMAIDRRGLESRFAQLERTLEQVAEELCESAEDARVVS